MLDAAIITHDDHPIGRVTDDNTVFPVTAIDDVVPTLQDAPLVVEIKRNKESVAEVTCSEMRTSIS